MGAVAQGTYNVSGRDHLANRAITTSKSRY